MDFKERFLVDINDKLSQQNSFLSHVDQSLENIYKLSKRASHIKFRDGSTNVVIAPRDKITMVHDPFSIGIYQYQIHVLGAVYYVKQEEFNRVQKELME